MTTAAVVATRDDRAGVIGLAAIGAAAVAIASAANPATIENGPVVCPFRLITGLPCPGCGLTRSWVYLMHGDWSAALHANPFGYLALAATIALISAVVVALVLRRPMPSLTPIIQSRMFRVVIAVWIAFAVVRAVGAM